MEERKSTKPTSRKTRKAVAKPEEPEELPLDAAEPEEVEEAPLDAAKPKEYEELPFLERTVSCDGYDALNVRETPSMRGKVVKTVPHGFKVMAAPSNGGWCALDDGGYVMDEFLG